MDDNVAKLNAELDLVRRQLGAAISEAEAKIKSLEAERAKLQSQINSLQHELARHRKDSEQKLRHEIYVAAKRPSDKAANVERELSRVKAELTQLQNTHNRTLQDLKRSNQEVIAKERLVTELRTKFGQDSW